MRPFEAYLTSQIVKLISDLFFQAAARKYCAPAPRDMSTQSGVRRDENPVHSQRGDASSSLHCFYTPHVIKTKKQNINLRGADPSLAFAQNKCFTRHLRWRVPQSTGVNASQDMLIPAAAIWRHAACCLHSATPNPTIPIALSSYLSADEPAVHLRQPAPVCACLCVCVCVRPPRSLLRQHIQSQHF